MNCFRITIFAVAKTICLGYVPIRSELWIAFELLSLQWQKQSSRLRFGALVGCELLSNYYLCSGKNNALRGLSLARPVVNCFRITIFAVAKTMWRLINRTTTELWIAFELLSLQWQKQFLVRVTIAHFCCELLSNYYLCSGKNNLFPLGSGIQNVVNCFRITIFAVAKTIGYAGNGEPRRCELLSNYYLCSGKNN